MGSVEISKEVGFSEIVPLALAVIQISSPLSAERFIPAPPKMRDIGRLGSLIPPINFPPHSARLNCLSSVAWMRRTAPGMLVMFSIVLRIEDGVVIVGGYKPLADILDHVVSGLAGIDSCAIRADHFIL